MTIKLETPAEAFAAVAWLVCAADRHGSVEEREFLYEQAQNLDIFQIYSLVEFQNLFGATFIRAFQSLPNGELFIDNRSIGSLIHAVKAVQSPELRGEAFKMAVGLARADMFCDEEKTLLEQLQRGLEIDGMARYWQRR